MFELRKSCVLCLILSFMGSAFGADIILNEYNAVSSTMFLNGGNALLDNEGGQASDSYFGRVLGNGGDWFELVVIKDHLNMSNWMLDIFIGGAFNETLTLTNHSIWSDLRSGTIITVSEDVESDVSYNPAAGDWWINVQANNGAGGLYITASNFAVSEASWQLQIRNSGGAIVFGPAGEGVSPASGVNDSEIFRLEATPSAAVMPSSADYDDADTQSTFGAANQWGMQELHLLRSVVAEPSTVTVLSPNGGEIMRGGIINTITWESTGTIATVLVEFSVDDGVSWSEVFPAAIGNTGSYDWLVPIVDSEQCQVRLVNQANTGVFDTTDGAFTIYECTLDGDLTGDCIIDINDFAVMAAYWLQDGNPYE